jgi:hypothetical protein
VIFLIAGFTFRTGNTPVASPNLHRLALGKRAKTSGSTHFRQFAVPHDSSASVAELAAREEDNRRTHRVEKNAMPNLEQNLAQVMVQIRQIERLLRGPTEEERQQMQEQLKELEAERERIMQQLMDGHPELPKPRKRDRERERERERERRRNQPREATADTSKHTDT